MEGQHDLLFVPVAAGGGAGTAAHWIPSAPRSAAGWVTLEELLQFSAAPHTVQLIPLSCETSGDSKNSSVEFSTELRRSLLLLARKTRRPHPGTSIRELGTKHPPCRQGRTGLKQQSGWLDPQHGRV